MKTKEVAKEGTISPTQTTEPIEVGFKKLLFDGIPAFYTKIRGESIGLRVERGVRNGVLGFFYGKQFIIKELEKQLYELRREGRGDSGEAVRLRKVIDGVVHGSIT